MYFVAISLRLDRLDGVISSSVQAGIYAHAAVMHIISSQDEELGRVLHDLASNKGFTVSLVKCTNRDSLLRLTFMGKRGLDAAYAVIDGFSKEPIIQLGPSRHRVSDVCLSGSPWTGVGTWADFLGAPIYPRFEFTFVTPTAFTKDDGHGRRFSSLYPEPNDMFRALAKRWQDLAGPVLPTTLDNYVRKGGCVVSAHCLQTETIKLQERTQVGFLGKATYTCIDPDDTYIRALNQLARFAFFSGVGYQTARGMGAVTVRLFA